MSRFKTLAAAIAILGCAGAVSAQDLWNGARAGMTPAQVRDAVPAAARGQLIDQGAEQVMRVNNLRAGGHDAVALFGFDAGGLRSVELRLAPKVGEPAIDPAEVKSQLTGKYGPPEACGAGAERCDWRDGATRITLLGPNSTDGAGVAIVYRMAPQGGYAGTEGAVTPVSVVRAFYAYLSRGDGFGAARLVTPEKRQWGELSAGALTGFFATLPGPIHLTAAWPRSDGDVFVRYQFVANGGRLCDGAADVLTTQVQDRVLIDAIRPYGQC